MFMCAAFRCTGVPGVGDSEVVIAVSVSRLQPEGVREAEDDWLAAPITDDPAASVQCPNLQMYRCTVQVKVRDI